MNKKQYVYTLYEKSDFFGDFENVAEYYDLKELQEKNGISLGNPKSIYYFIQDEIKEQNKLLNDRFLIIKEKAEI